MVGEKIAFSFCCKFGVVCKKWAELELNNPASVQVICDRFCDYFFLFATVFATAKKTVANFNFFFPFLTINLRLLRGRKLRLQIGLRLLGDGRKYGFLRPRFPTTLKQSQIRKKRSQIAFCD
ncbi:hypothetical protein RND81_02G122500 [Saponaria officinalis]|uniref:Uncharacterized protein n=1 Tax=Saponaria officinalis TaxID=3572 RepID=A0AAW1MTJ2_SAPOF